MIGFFLKAGDEEVSKMFSPYIWDDFGFATLFEKKFLNKGYGKDLKQLLIMYYVEGKFDVHGPEAPKISNYSNKNRDISVAITVRADQFHDRSEFDKKEFIIISTLNALKMVKRKVREKKIGY